MSANSLNLARRLSSRNEPDFLQEDMFEADVTTPPSSPYSHRACTALLDKVSPDSPLPKECDVYQDLKVELQRRNSDQGNHNIAFAGMNAGEAAMARAARERGHLSHAQITRRLTSNGKNAKKSIW